jgi:hypothetical protein
MEIDWKEGVVENGRVYCDMTGFVQSHADKQQ